MLLQVFIEGEVRIDKLVAEKAGISRVIQNLLDKELEGLMSEKGKKDKPLKPPRERKLEQSSMTPGTPVIPKPQPVVNLKRQRE